MNRSYKHCLRAGPRLNQASVFVHKTTARFILIVREMLVIPYLLCSVCIFTYQCSLIDRGNSLELEGNLTIRTKKELNGVENIS